MVNRGIDRERAYKISQQLAFEAKEKDEYLSKVVLKDPEIKKLFTAKEISNLFSWQRLKQNIDYIYQRI
jgi:adenylosuccinate lyase